MNTRNCVYHRKKTMLDGSHFEFMQITFYLFGTTSNIDLYTQYSIRTKFVVFVKSVMSDGYSSSFRNTTEYSHIPTSTHVTCITT